MSDVQIHEFRHEEEFFGKFIQVQGPHSVLVFNYGPGARELAEQIAALMGDWEWLEDRETFEESDG